MFLSYQNIKQVSKSAYEFSKDKKTRTAAVILGLYNIVLAAFPDKIDPYTDNIIRKSIDFVIIIGGADWVWRNRFEVVNWIKGLVNNIVNRFKK